jgi:hypothetical protein
MIKGREAGVGWERLQNEMQVCARRSRRNGLIVMLEITAHF